MNFKFFLGFLLFGNILFAQTRELSTYRFPLGSRYYIDGDITSRKIFMNELKTYPRSLPLYKKYVFNRNVGVGFAIAQLLTIYPIFKNSIDGDLEATQFYLYANIGFGIVGTYFASEGTSYLRRAIYEYNHQDAKKPKFTFGKSSDQWIGLKVHLDGR
jgi:hypothetical protein